MKAKKLAGVAFLLALVALALGSSVAQWPALAWHAGGTDIVTVAPRKDALHEKRVLGHYMTWYKTPRTYGASGCVNSEARGAWSMWNMCGHNPNTITGTHGFRDIAAVHYPLIGPYDSADSKVIEYHLLQALAAGVDTFVVDYYGQDDSGGIDEATLRALQQVEEMNARYATQFKIALMYDEGVLTDISPTLRLGKVISDFDYMLRTYTTSPAYLWADGKPAMFYFPKGPILSPAQLGAVSTDFSLVYIDFMPDYAPVMKGSYAWVKADPSWMPDGSNWGEPYLRWYYPELDYRSTSVSTLTFGVGGVWAGFDDVGVGREWSCNDHRWMDRQGGQVYSRTWDILNTYNNAVGITYTIPVSWVQLITLNDHMEGTTLFASVAITGQDGQDYGYGYGYQYVQQTETHTQKFKGMPPDDELDIYVAQHIYNARLVSGTVSNTVLIESALSAFHSGHYTTAMALADEAAGIPAPINVTALNAGGTCIVSWQDQPGATLASGHRVSFGLESGKYTFSTVALTGSFAILEGLIPDETYYVAVTTLGSTNPCETWYVSESWYSDEVMAPPMPYAIYLPTVLKDE